MTGVKGSRSGAWQGVPTLSRTWEEARNQLALLEKSSWRVLAHLASTTLPRGTLPTPAANFLAGFVFLKANQWKPAEPYLRRAVELNPSPARYHKRLSFVLRKQGQWWQEASALQETVARAPKSAHAFYKLGIAYCKMGRFDEAARAFETACRLRPHRPWWYYRCGEALERAGNHERAQQEYEKVFRYDETKLLADLGIGLYHQRRGAWALAKNAYCREIQLRCNPTAELLYRAGLACDRCYDWLDAQSYYAKACAWDPTHVTAHYRTGFVLERQSKWLEAASAYRQAASIVGKPTPYIYFRQGYCLTQAGRVSEATEAFLLSRYETLFPNKTELARPGSVSCQALAFYHRGRSLEACHDWEGAAAAYDEATKRRDSNSAEWWCRYGRALSRLGCHDRACDAFLMMEPIRRAHGVPKTTFDSNVAFRRQAIYLEYLACLPVDRNVIVYESYHGASMSGNPLALFRTLRKDDEATRYTHVWVIDQEEKIHPDYRNDRQVVFVRRQSELYLRYLATAHLLINNVSFPEYFVRRDEQRYLNTWHGTPIKSLGKDLKGQFLGHKNITRNFLQCSHMLAPCQYTLDILLDKYDVRSLMAGATLITGYPRADLTLSQGPSERKHLRRLLGITDDRPLVLYAPTWRGNDSSDKSTDIQRTLFELEALADINAHVVFRAHHLVEDQLSDAPCAAILPPPWLDTNELLSIVDVLISDYSSIIFDFLATGRAIILNVYDLEDYRRQRGLYFSLDELPATQCRSPEKVVAAVNLALAAAPLAGENRAAAIAKFCPLDDGHASRRALDFLNTKSQPDAQPTGAVRLAMYTGPFISNGILSSFQNLLKALDPNTIDLWLAVDPSTIASRDERLEQFRKLPGHVHVLPRCGAQAQTTEQHWLESKLQTNLTFPSSEMWEIHLAGYRHEYRRLFGTACFDAVTNFEGYNLFWTTLLAVAPENIRNTLYQHNDMAAERSVRFPYLETSFHVAKYYDALISVSEATRNLNCKNLASRYNLAPEQFLSCDNLQDPERTRALATEPLTDSFIRFFRDRGPHYVSLGRLSIEKDHVKLLRAFATVRKTEPKATLSILGDGPLMGTLRTQVKELGIHDWVMLPGRVDNPFPVVRHADCFVLSSNHEGQPMVLLEAMILGKPIVATDITGSRGVLTNRPGLLVPNNEAGLVDGMLTYNSCRLEKPFHVDDYQKSALTMFYRAALDQTL